MDYNNTEQEILRRLDIRAEAVAWGVQFTRNEPNESGWIPCHAVGRDDADPSAAVCVASENGSLGRYIDRGMGNESISFWELGVLCDRFRDWRETRQHLADKTGVSLPAGKNGKADLTADIDYTDPLLSPNLIQSFAQNKSPITADAVATAGGKGCRFANSLCIVFEATRDFRKPSAVLFYRVDGKPFAAWKDLPERRFHLKAGSKHGWIVPGGFDAIQSASIIWLVEGLTDALALHSHLPAGHAVITSTGGAGGAGGKDGPPCSIPFKGKSVYVIGDADSAGQEGAERSAAAVTKFADAVRIVRLPYDVTEKHGKDLRYFFGDGHSFDELQKLADAAALFTAMDRRNEKGKRPDPEDLDSLYIVLPEARTDLANARRFVRSFGSQCRYCHQWGEWLIWDGKRWNRDLTAEAVRMAKKVSDQLWHEAREAGSGDLDTLLGFAKTSASCRSVSAILTMAASEPGIPVLSSALDTDAYLLNCINGTVNLRTGEIREHRPEDLITKLCPTTFNPDAESYQWDRFLEAIFDGNDNLIGFVQRLFGYALTGDVSEQVLPIFWGDGSNGKSTLLNAFMAAIGDDYCLQAPHNFLMTAKGERHPTEQADLFGKRFVSCAETEDGARLSESMVKQLTGGETIRARRMREDFWSFAPTHKLILSSNHKPEVRGTDHAIWRRLAMLPFNVKFWNPDKGESGPPELKQDKQIAQKLFAEREGILAWAVRGCMEWQAGGLRMPAEVRAATKDYRSEQDVIETFIEECCVQGNENYNAKASMLYDAYSKWTHENGEYTLSQKNFGKQLTERGFQRFTSNGVWYKRIALREWRNSEGTE